MNNQQARIMECCVAKLTKYPSKTPHLCSRIIHLVKTSTKTYLLGQWWCWQPRRASGIGLSQKLHLQLPLQKYSWRGLAGPWQWHSCPLIQSAAACIQCYSHREHILPAPNCTAYTIFCRSHHFFPRCLQEDSIPNSL